MGLRTCQLVYLFLAGAWFASPFFAELPTALKAVPIYVGIIMSITVFSQYREVVTKSPFTVFAVASALYSLIVAFLIKDDWELALQVNMLSIGMLAYYLATPHVMRGYWIIFMILAVVIPSAVLNNIFIGSSFFNIAGALSGARTTFTILGGTHHVMGLAGALAIIGACTSITDGALKDKTQRFWVCLSLLIGGALLLTSGARASLFGLLLAAAFTLVITALMPKLRCLMLAVPIIAVPVLYGTSLFLSEGASSAFNFQLFSDQSQADFTSGRNQLWQYHWHLFRGSPLLGNQLADLQAVVLSESTRERASILLPDGSISAASTESFYDYFLARDGLSSILTFGFFYALYAAAIVRKSSVLLMYILFWMFTAFAQPVLRIAYTFDNFLMAVCLSQAYRRSLFTNQAHRTP